MNLDELLADLRLEQNDCLARASSFEEARRKAECSALMIAARIQGIEEAREAYGHEMIVTEAKKPRRDIRAMVRQLVGDKPHLLALGEDAKVSQIAGQLECRPSQVAKALRAIFAPTGNGEAP